MGVREALRPINRWVESCDLQCPSGQDAWLKPPSFPAFSLTDEAVLSEASSASWWKKTEEQLRGKHGPDLCLNPIILFTDGAHLSRTGKQSTKVAMVACGNFKNRALQRAAAREVVGLIPSVKWATKAQSKKKDRNSIGLVQAEDLRLMQKSIEIMTKDIRVSAVPPVAAVSTQSQAGLLTDPSCIVSAQACAKQGGYRCVVPADKKERLL